jgi:ArsR family transcriptional regulator
MNAAWATGALGALAHEHRLAVFRMLVQAGPEGLSAGEIATRLGVVPSSLTFHVQSLQRSGLITRRRDGRQLYYSADFGSMNELVEYLTRNCCGGKHSCMPSINVEARGVAAPLRRARAGRG